MTAPQEQPTQFSRDRARDHELVNQDRRGDKMSETKHTPGPWSIYDYGEEEAPTLVIHKDSNTRVCFMATPGSHGDPARIEADAHLITAAPDLLAAIMNSDDAHWTPAMRAAMKKARGQIV